MPRPRLHLIRFHCVLAPNAKLRPLVMLQGSEAQEQGNEAAIAADCEIETTQARPSRISWVRLRKRVFDIDMQRCPNCGAGELKIIAAILERQVIEKFPHPPGAQSPTAAQGPGARDVAGLKPSEPGLARACRHQHTFRGPQRRSTAGGDAARRVGAVATNEG